MHFSPILLAIVLLRHHACTAASSLSATEIDDPTSTSYNAALSVRYASIQARDRTTLLRRLRARGPRPSTLFGKRLSLLDTNTTVHYDASLMPALMSTDNETSVLRGTVSQLVDSAENSTATYAGLAAILATAPGTSTATSTTGQTQNSAASTTVSEGTYANILHYAKFSAAAYETSCSFPNGATMVKQISPETSSSPYGYISRDDTTKEIIIAFRGDSTMSIFTETVASGQKASLVDATAANYGLNAPTGTLVNVDTLNMHAKLLSTVSQASKAILASYSGYGITFTGHGVGGSIATLSAIAHTVELGSSVPIQVVTYGSPRIGNGIWSAYADSILLTDGTARLLRVTHEDDNVPQALAQSYGYQHAGIELYQMADTASAAGMTQCTGIEDAACNDAAYTTDAYVANTGQSTGTSLTASTAAGSGTTATVEDPAVAGTTIPEVAGTTTPSTSTGAPTGTSAIACSLCSSTDCIDCIEDSDTGIAPAGAETTAPTLDTSGSIATASAASPAAGSLSVDSSLTSSTSNTFLTGIGNQQAGSIVTGATSTSPAVNNDQSSTSSNPISSFLSSVVSSISNIFSRDISRQQSDEVLTKRATTFTANAAHLTYLGIAMTTGGAEYCTAAATSGVVSTTANGLNVPTTTNPYGSVTSGTSAGPTLSSPSGTTTTGQGGTLTSPKSSTSASTSSIASFSGSTLMGLTSAAKRLETIKVGLILATLSMWLV